MDPDKFIKDSGMKLIKLHGSLNWLEKKDGTIREIEISRNFDEAKQNSAPGTFLEEMVIYPLFQKQLYVFPYIQLFYLFNQELSKKNIWIIIGYSFRDSIIKNMFFTYLKQTNNKIIIVDPDNSIYDLFSNFKKQVFIINRKFGEKNTFIETNSLIANELETCNRQNEYW